MKKAGSDGKQIDWKTTSVVQVSCAKGVPPLLERELQGLGFPVLQQGPVSVETRGSLHDCMRMNLHLRTAHRVLYRLATFPCTDLDRFYDQVRGWPWESCLEPDGYFTVGSFARVESIRDPRMVSLRCKDAVADRMRAVFGRRPDSGPERKGACIWVYWTEGEVSLFLDSSGESLSRRGYRRNPMDAPMQETLAAACLLDTGWDGTEPFINPMCGSGTLAIEAALIARGQAPGSLGRPFAFQHLTGFDRTRWEALLQEASPTRKELPPLVASDLRHEAIRATRLNAEAAGVVDDLLLETCAFEKTTLPGEGGLVFFNPEYGKRLGQEDDLVAVYRGIGDFMKQQCMGRTGAVFTGNLRLARQVGLRPRSKGTFFSGELECRFLQFDLYS